MDHRCVDLEARDIGHKEIVDKVNKQNRCVLHKHKSDTTMSRTVVTDGSPLNRNLIGPSTLLHLSLSPLPCVITPSDMHSTAFRALETDSWTGSLVHGTPCPTHQKTHPLCSHEVTSPIAFLPGPKTPIMMLQLD